MSKLIVCIDPGHGMSNRRANIYDPGATVKVGKQEFTEAGIVMDWANELKIQLEALGCKVIRTRINDTDAAPVGDRAGIAKKYGCDALISLHCNAADGRANGTETFHRNNAAFAKGCNDAVRLALGTKDRGIKTEEQSQHSRLAVLNFPTACLIELGFIDNEADRSRLLDQKLMLLACQNLALSIMTTLKPSR